MCKMLTVIKSFQLTTGSIIVGIMLGALFLVSGTVCLNNNKIVKESNIKYLALGDSYTIGEAVEKGKSFPLQLASQLNTRLGLQVKTKIIATTGWRTDQLLQAIEKEKLTGTYDFVTLLIGVNNQFQNQDFGQYEVEFLKLLDTAVKLSGNNKANVLVLSIPDYGYTPFGKDKKGISKGVDKYNAYAEKITTQKEITFLNITDITRRGLENPDLVAADNLHVSAKGYAEFVERIMALKFSN